MKVLDLFSGTGSATAAFRDRGHEVLHLDLTAAHGPVEILADIRDFAKDRAKLRKLPVVAGLDRRTVSYCQYGDRVMKPTDIFGAFPPTWTPKPICSNGAPCHVRAPRGSQTGTQGYGRILDPRGGGWNAQHPASINSYRTTDGRLLERPSNAALRAVVPHALSLEICLAVESSQTLKAPNPLANLSAPPPSSALLPQE